MKYRNERIKNEKNKEQEWKKEHKAGGFRCSHCKQWVAINSYMGTINRNHCNMCLWSKHVDISKGDRRASCHGGMRPIGLTFKHEGVGRQGEIMLIHECAACRVVSINRIAGDDDNERILSVFDTSIICPDPLNRLVEHGITKLIGQDRDEVNRQLFGEVDR